jgi:hypothetical protein
LIASGLNNDQAQKGMCQAFGSPEFSALGEGQEPESANGEVLAGIAYRRLSFGGTLKLASVQGPNEVTIATSVASRPRAIRMRPMRGML